MNKSPMYNAKLEPELKPRLYHLQLGIEATTNASQPTALSALQCMALYAALSCWAPA